MEELESLTARAAELIAHSPRVVVFTGAGVSTESGIPDFRGPGGIWERYDPDEFTIQRFLASAQIQIKIWRMLTSEFFGQAKPNPAHYAIAELERLGKLECVITQNVDNLHQEAGSSPERVYELHGNLRWALCLSCGQRYPMERVKQRLQQGEEHPDCEHCGGILKPAGVFFGESLPAQELAQATWHSENCDLCLVVGSTLLVTPAAYMPQYALRSGAKLAIVNLSPTHLDRYALVILRYKAGEVLPRIVEKTKAMLKGG